MSATAAMASPASEFSFRVTIHRASRVRIVSFIGDIFIGKCGSITSRSS